MAPEVIEHSPYNHQADIFSFAIVLWELLTGRVPYADMTPLQAAVGVVQKGLRPPIPANCPPALATLMQDCWVRNSKDRPSFETLKHRMVDITTSWHEVRRFLKPSSMRLRRTCTTQPWAKVVLMHHRFSNHDRTCYTYPSLCKSFELLQ